MAEVLKHGGVVALFHCVPQDLFYTNECGKSLGKWRLFGMWMSFARRSHVTPLAGEGGDEKLYEEQEEEEEEEEEKLEEVLRGKKKKGKKRQKKKKYLEKITKRRKKLAKSKRKK
ncbi:hypothetical protein E2C01_057158 [Portunus trituberculatus]|uniref:Uncharacterized protein n=1 Tax=Portunus trituberculatus TaxID=210409 RepID=A0A5B7GZL9_PORTR|nr:hypothetical protein [Portunus trituberculatus]